MDLIVIIVRLIARALSNQNPRPAASGDPNDLVRQIQARIEAARAQGAAAQPGGPQDLRGVQPNRSVVSQPGPMRAPIRPASRPAARPSARPAAKTAQQRKFKRKAPAALPAVARAPAIAKVIAPAPPVAPSPRPAIAKVDAKVLNRWLRPQTLRAQFILTEIFQPPVALRESHLS